MGFLTSWDRKKRHQEGTWSELSPLSSQNSAICWGASVLTHEPGMVHIGLEGQARGVCALWSLFRVVWPPVPSCRLCLHLPLFFLVGLT